MSYSPFLIADFSSGLSQDKAPWLLPQDAFQTLFNGFIRHGVIKKRQGMEFLAEMVHQQTTITNISAAATAVVTVAAAAGLANDQEIQISRSTGGSYSSLNGTKFVIKNLVGLNFDLYESTGTTPIDTTAFGVYGGSGVLCLFPALPIMGIKQFVSSQTAKDTLIWDTERAGIYNGTTEAIDPIDTADIFTGDEANFISVGYFGKTSAFATPTFFFTNFNGDSAGAIDNMRTFVTGATTTTAFVPNTNPTGVANLVNAAQFIHALKQRLLLFNTIEGAGNVQYPQRVRWSRALNPAASGSNWDDVTPGNGGFVDAPTSDVIISTIALQDQIIVYFSNSTWILQPTSDPSLPFRWSRLNSFRASDAPYGSIGFDRYGLSFGIRGIFGSDGVEVKRVDDNIQDFIVDEFNIDYMTQVYSERNYSDLRSWTLYPSSDVSVGGAQATTSNRALVRTDEERSWSVFSAQVIDDAGNLQNFSCLGHGNAAKDYAFSDFDGITQPDYAFSDFGDEAFNSFYVEQNAELFLGGDQIGRVFILEKSGSDNGEDIEFDVVSAAWNPFKQEGGEAQLGFLDIYADADPSASLTVEFFKDTMNSPYATETTNLLPKIGFLAGIQGISQANPAVVTADSHGLPTGSIVYLYGMQGMVEIQGGPYTITNVNENSFSLDGIDSSAFTAYTGGGSVTLNPFAATKCWKRVYGGGIGYEHFVRISHTGQAQIINLHGFMPWFRKAGNRMVQ